MEFDHYVQLGPTLQQNQSIRRFHMVPRGQSASVAGQRGVLFFGGTTTTDVVDVASGQAGLTGKPDLATVDGGWGGDNDPCGGHTNHARSR